MIYVCSSNFLMQDVNFLANYYFMYMLYKIVSKKLMNWMDLFSYYVLITRIHQILCILIIRIHQILCIDYKNTPDSIKLRWNIWKLRYNRYHRCIETVDVIFCWNDNILRCFHAAFFSYYLVIWAHSNLLYIFSIYGFGLIYCI